MPRSVVGVMDANMMLVQCGIRIAHLIGVLEHNVGDSPDLGIIGTTSLRDLKGLHSSRQQVEKCSIRPCLVQQQVGRLCHRSKFDGV